MTTIPPFSDKIVLFISSLPMWQQDLIFAFDRTGYELIGDCCSICGRKMNENHHIIAGLGKLKFLSPRVSVCGFGNNLPYCHGLLHHHHIHIRWNNEFERYEYASFKEGVGMDFALIYGKWQELKVKNFD